RKMSKSYGNFIALSDDADTIRAKVKSMFTDPERIKRTDPGRPALCNVFKYYELFKPELRDEIKKQCLEAAIGCVEDKERLAEFLVEFLKPFQKKRKAIEKEQGYLEDVLKEGALKAGDFAANTIIEVRNAVGI
ncbi:MAG: tryptophan--tRNA ligase, partial [Candidatus Omnitrophica bacterium]|nr:tryptophan--tRNA ligase [Candidatus Omnitrophota bacterium]